MPSTTKNEGARLEVLRQFNILDTGDEESFDDITRLAAYICQTPIAVISLVDSDRQWFKSRVGLSVNETARDISFCTHAIQQQGPFIVRDAMADDRFKRNPLVTSDPHIRFYAGSPLASVEGFNIGTLCVIDRYPRELNHEQIAALRLLSHQVMALLELRRDVAALQRELVAEKKKLTKATEVMNQRSSE